MVDAWGAGDETRQLQALHSFRVLDVQPGAGFERVTSMAMRLFSVPVAVLNLDDSGTDEKRHELAVGFFEALRNRDEAGSERVFVVADACADPRCEAAPPLLGDEPARFYAGCTVIAPDGRRMGTLALMDTRSRMLSDDDFELFRELANMAADVYRSLSMATCDALTKLANRRGFEGIANHMLAVALRLDIPLTLVQLDLDGFKRINDSEGHEAGDRLLTTFARHLLKNSRESDVVARLGGDEFCVLMSGARPDDVRACLDRLESSLRRDGERSIGFSAGIATFDRRRHRTVSDLLRDADGLMYERKRRKQTSSSSGAA